MPTASSTGLKQVIPPGATAGGMFKKPMPSRQMGVKSPIDKKAISSKSPTDSKSRNIQLSPNGMQKQVMTKVQQSMQSPKKPQMN
jgi:energy-converting hydrogenase Eha subunit F